MPKSRVEAIIPQLTEAFEHCRARVFNFADIESLRLQNQDTWELPPSTSNARFLKQLIQHTPMQKFELRFPSKTRTLYSWGQVPLLERLSHALPTAYMSHATACYLNKLTPTLPTAIYLNNEQSHASSETAQLSQDRIDTAFQRPQRMPSQIADVEGHTVHLCSGRNTWNLGITNIQWNVQDEARVITLRSTTPLFVSEKVFQGDLWVKCQNYISFTDDHHGLPFQQIDAHDVAKLCLMTRPISSFSFKNVALKR